MGFNAAHLSELGISLWRLRSDPVPEPVQAAPVERPEAEAGEAPVVTRARVSEPPSAVDAARQLRAEQQQRADAQAQQDARDQAEAAAARRAAVAGLDWDALAADLARQRPREGAQQAVFGVGARDADVMIIGEAPGADEDRQGEPFVGRAGQLLDQMLAAIGLSRRDNVYIANICKFRPPNNRDPRPQEIEADWPYLARQIELLAPKLLIAVGRIAAQRLLDSAEPIGRLRGREHVFGEQRVPLLVTYHPAYLLRSPREKAKVWRDLKQARAMLLAHADD